MRTWIYAGSNGMQDKSSFVVRRELGLKRHAMGTILLILLILLVIGALPTWPYSSGWGYYPTGGLGVVLVVILILVLLRVI
jgi:hypothetical protein